MSKFNWTLINARWVFTSIPIACLLTVIVCILYTNAIDNRREKAERKSDQQWCELVVFYDDYYMQHPPVTDLQKKQAVLMHNRRLNLGC